MNGLRLPRVPGYTTQILSTTLMATVGTTPSYLLSVQAVTVRADLGFGAAQFGVLISAFFTFAALVATCSGPLFDRIAPRTGVVVAGALSVTGSLFVAGVADSYALLLIGAAIVGSGHASTQMAANASVNGAIPANRQGLAFSVKQSSGPAALLVASLLAQLIGLTVGWRWTFVVTAAAAAVVAGVTARTAPRQTPPAPETSGGGGGRPPRPPAPHGGAGGGAAGPGRVGGDNKPSNLPPPRQLTS
ncbi:MFS transporter, partial [Tsukamurella sp. NPDC003166]|uniref:MFS transporter n=1 Tax=Tsukamurella sp. NPDC003166 TaxID=3154444 RepID=UPI0033A761C2